MIVLSLLCLNANMQACETTGSQAQTTVEVNSFNISGTALQFSPLDIVVDGSNNKYFFYEYSGSGDENIRATKIAADGSYTWTKKYTGMVPKRNSKSVVISNDGTKIRMLCRASDDPVRLSEISTSNYTTMLFTDYINISKSRH